MRALVLNGALAGDEGLAPIERAICAALTARGWSTASIQLRDAFIAHCQGCFNCWVKTPGLCATRDDARDVVRELIRSDLLVLLSPITFGGYSSEIKKALDRAIGLLSPFFARIDGDVHHAPRYTKYPSLLAVGVSADRDPDEAKIFASLVARNALNHRAPTHAACIVSREDTPDQIRDAVARVVDAVGAWRGAA